SDGRLIAALLTSASSPPVALTNVSNPRATAAGSATSNGRSTAASPISPATARASFSEWLKLIPTRAPLCAHAIAIARPMPRLAPVTTTRLPSSIDAFQHDRGVLAPERERVRQHRALRVRP